MTELGLTRDIFKDSNVYYDVKGRGQDTPSIMADTPKVTLITFGDG